MINTTTTVPTESDAVGSAGLPVRNAQSDPTFTESFARGIIYFAYSPSTVKLKKYIKAAADSVSTLRTFNKSIRVALATNGNVSQTELRSMGFSDMVAIDSADVPDHEGPQWWTRTLYLSKSPYNQTIQVHLKFVFVAKSGQFSLSKRCCNYMVST